MYNTDSKIAPKNPSILEKLYQELQNGLHFGQYEKKHKFPHATQTFSIIWKAPQCEQL